jgi:hypothetical protein
MRVRVREVRELRKIEGGEGEEEGLIALRDEVSNFHNSRANICLCRG